MADIRQLVPVSGEWWAVLLVSPQPVAYRAGPVIAFALMDDGTIEPVIWDEDGILRPTHPGDVVLEVGRETSRIRWEQLAQKWVDDQRAADQWQQERRGHTTP
jgi:hypothetical protein